MFLLLLEQPRCNLGDLDSLSAQAVDYSSSIVVVHENVELVVNVLVPQVRLYHSIVARVTLGPHDEVIPSQSHTNKPVFALLPVRCVPPGQDKHPEPTHLRVTDSIPQGLINLVEVVLREVVRPAVPPRRG